MSQALQLRSADTMAEWSVIREQASILVKTGFLPQSIKSPEQAMAIILTGRELGIGAMAALNTINVISGKPTISPQLMLALINRSGLAEDIKIEAAADGATVTMKRKARTSYTAYFGPKEAMSLGLHSKDNYKKQSGTMYKWRAVADAARVVFPDVVLGLYAPDEMGAEVDLETGEVIEMPTPRAHLPPVASQPADEASPEQLLETDLNKLAMTAQAPFKSPARIKLEVLIKEINKTGIGYAEIQYQVERITGKRELAKLSDDDCGITAMEFDEWLRKITVIEDDIPW